ncbi:MAG: hypothetical protein ACRD3I_04945 [Terriglobales bacterium]
MVTAAHIQAQVRRLAAHRFADRRPGDPAGIRAAIGTVLAQHARSDEHATLVVDECVQTMSCYPTPVDSISLCTQISVPVPGRPAEPACGECHGTGCAPAVVCWLGMEYPAVRRCDCTRSAADGRGAF